MNRRNFALNAIYKFKLKCYLASYKLYNHNIVINNLKYTNKLSKRNIEYNIKERARTKPQNLTSLSTISFVH